MNSICSNYISIMIFGNIYFITSFVYCFFGNFYNIRFLYFCLDFTANYAIEYVSTNCTNRDLSIIHFMLNNMFKVPTEQHGVDEKEEGVFETIKIYGYLVFLVEK